jgi:flagellin
LQSSYGSNASSDREALQKEVSALQTELTRIAETTSFGGQKLLDGSFGSKGFQVGATAGETITMSLSDISADKLGETGRENMAGQLSAANITSLLTEDATTGNSGTLSFAHTDADGASRSINVDLSNVTDADSLASALNASLGGLGVVATNTAGDIDFTGSVLNDETLVATATEGDGATGITVATSIAASGTNDEVTGHTDDIDISTAVGSSNALAIIDNALSEISTNRAELGALQNRFSHTIDNLSNIQENVSASRSRIQDTDFAVETAQMTKNQILQQAGTSILAQANQIPQAALSLLGG